MNRIQSSSLKNVGDAAAIVLHENTKDNPKIGNVIKEIMARAGRPGEAQTKWIILKKAVESTSSCYCTED